jgi:hypothetical protein
MQHYGLPTRLLDWTTSLLVATYFCCHNNEGQDGAIYIFDPEDLNWYGLNSLLDIQVTSPSIPAFYEALIYNTGNMLNDESMINHTKIKDIKGDMLIQHRFIHRILSDNIQFKSLLLWVGLIDRYSSDGSKLDHGYHDLTSWLSNVIPFKPPILNTRIRQQHGCFTFHGGMYFNGKEFIKFKKMEKNYHLKGSRLLKLKIKASDKRMLLHELDIAGIREATLFPEMDYQAREIEKKFKYELNL